MTEIIIAIALWCSNPSYTKLSPSDVDSCRQELIKCLGDDLSLNNTKKQVVCFKNRILN